MSKIPKKSRDKDSNHQKFISRITKTLYYGKFPKTEGLSLPVTELAAELFSEAQRGRSLDRLHCDDAANISRNACVSPCSLVLAILYLERLKKTCPEYVERTASSDLFLVSLMVSCKFLYDDGEIDEVFVKEWAESGGTSVKHLVQLEKDFLKAIKWEVFVGELSFWKKLEDIEKTLAKRQGLSRGYFTYTELKTLLATVELQIFIQNVLAICAVLVACYCVALLTLLSSVFIVSHIPGNCLQSGKSVEVEAPQTFIRNEVTKMDVVKTGIFLASIESFLTPFCNNSMKEEKVSWDWWNSPSLKWLSETSVLLEEKMQSLQLFFWRDFYENYVQVKFLDLEDHIHKSTKTRIQDQLENSWHAEWTDTIKEGFQEKYFYLPNVKA